MKRRLVVVSLLVSATVGVGWWVFAAMTGPLYAVGSVAALPASALTPPPQHGEGWRVADGVELHHFEQGTGAPVMVVHGGPAVPIAAPWPSLAALGGDYTFHYYDQRGAGRSTRPFDRFRDDAFYRNMLQLERELGLGAQIADLERIRRVLDVERICLIGHSFGGLIATLYAAEFPHRVDRLVLVAPAGLLSTPGPDRDLFAQAETRLAGEERLRFVARRDDYFDFAAHFARSERELAELHFATGNWLLRAMGYPVAGAGSPSSEDAQLVGGWAAFACYFSFGRRWDLRAALQLVTAPTTILIGVDDELARAGAESYAAIPGAELRTLGRETDGRPVRHRPYDEAPRQFAEAVRRALARPR